MAYSIVVLDGYTANPNNDIGWDVLADLGNLTVYDRTPAELVAERAAEADILLTNKTVITAQMIAEFKKVKYIGLLSTGTNVVDLEAAAQRGIPVTNVPSYSTNAVAQMVFAYILHFSSRVAAYSDSVYRGDWANCADFTYMVAPLTELTGKTLGIIGYGAIGRCVAKIARAFDMRVLVYSRTKSADISLEEWCDRDTLLRQSDFVTLHCPLTPQTQGMICKDTIEQMKRSAILINTARGPIVCESDLAHALKEGRIAGAAVDVMEQEPPKANSPLFSAPNCIITPHIAWAPQETRMRLLRIVAQNIQSFLEGKPQNVVNKIL